MVPQSYGKKVVLFYVKDFNFIPINIFEIIIGRLDIVNITITELALKIKNEKNIKNY